MGIHTASLQSAGVQAVAIRANLRIGTLRVVLASSTDHWALDGHTVARSVRHRIAGALADHGSQRQGIQDVAGLLRTADMRSGARIGASLIYAGQLRGTVGILGALGLRGNLWDVALDERIASVARTALALRLVATTHADGVDGTCLLFANWTADAVQTVAGLVIGTILVVLTVSGDAGDEGVALGSGRTTAHGLVILRQALGATAAANLSMGARIDAVLVQTGLVVRTVGIDLALG